jgi:hypothetical protein
MAETQDLSFIDALSEQDIDALLAGDVDSISTDGLDLLDELDDDQFGLLIGREPQEFVPTTGRENLAGALRGFQVDPVLAQQVSESEFTDALVGFGRTLSSMSTGLQQIAASDVEALALGKIEEREREKFAEIDDGFGGEDVGQALAFTASLLAPGGSAVKGVTLAQKAITGLRNLSGSLGGASILTGLLEGAKGVTPEESRALNAAKGAGITLAGGKVLSGGARILKESVTGGLIGKTLAAFGLGALANQPARRTLSEGIGRGFARFLFGKRAAPTDAELRLAAAQGGQEVRRLVSESARAEARAAETQFGLGTGARTWDAFMDIVKGPKSPKTGRRMKGSGLEGVRGTKAAKEAEIDILGERNRVVSTLMSAAQRRNEQTGEVVFDIPAVEAAWRSLKQDDNFKRVFGRVLKDGSFSPGKVAKKVDEFVEQLLTRGPNAADDTTLTAAEILRRGSEDVIQATERGLTRASKLREDFGTEAVTRGPSGTALNAAAIGMEQVASQDAVDEAVALITGGDWFGFLDYFDTLEERATEMAEVQ